MKFAIMIDSSQQTYTKDKRAYLMGIAMIGVVLFHIAQHQEYTNPVSRMLLYVFGNGYLGVDIFFLLSAYGLCYSYNNNSLKRFYWNRFIRIIPAYPLALIIGYVEAGTHWKQACYEFVQQITGIAIFNGTLDILWYMEALIILYVFFPIFYKLCQRIHSLGIGAILIICVIVHVSLIYISDYWLQITVNRVPAMIVGVLTYIYDRENNKQALILLYGSLALMSIMPLLSGMFLYLPAVLLLIVQVKRYIFKKALTFVGKHSLEIFIGHHFAFWIFNYSSWGYYVNLLLALILTAVFALIIYYLQRGFKALMSGCL